VHGFDEFYGNLYHLNAEEEPEQLDYPKDPAFRKRFGPRGLLDCKATDEDDATVDPRFGRVGKQTIKDTGPLTKKRMETADEEFIDRTTKFIRKNHEAGKPWFAWVATSRMHFYTHLKKESQGVTGLGIFADGMVEHDGQVGQLLDLLDELKITEDTIVIYTVDNGPHYNEWPDGGLSPFRGEKNTNWEGGYRVPCMVRWPGKIKAGDDLERASCDATATGCVTLMSAAGEPDIIARSSRRAGCEADGKTYKVHLDGYDFLRLPHRGQADKRPRQGLLLRVNDGGLSSWACATTTGRSCSLEQRAEGTLPRLDRAVHVTLRVPKLFNLRSDPFERADIDSNNYYDLVDPTGVFVHRAGADVRRRVHGDLQGVPAAAEAGEVQRRGRAEEADRGELGQLTSPRLTRRSTGARVPGARSRISRRRPSPTASAGSATAWITKQTTANTASRGPPGTPVPTSATTARF
jgi:arylsulfatase A-like enzyme